MPVCPLAKICVQPVPLSSPQSKQQNSGSLGLAEKTIVSLSKKTGSGDSSSVLKKKSKQCQVDDLFNS